MRNVPLVGFTVGVCASDQAPNIASLLNTIADEPFPAELALKRIVVVASGCPQSTRSQIEALRQEDPRILLLEEAQRQGKAAAVNQIISHAEGDFLVLVNSDASPARGAIRSLLETISANNDVGSVSALPVIPSGATLTWRVLDLMWTAHNVASTELNHAGLSNHNCDELMVVRTSLLQKLPSDVVNDGAYIGGSVYAKGYRIMVSDDSRVNIDLPVRISDLIQQRRRILFGHAQVWKDLGRAPRTIESLMFTKPRLAMKLFGKAMAVRPALLPVFPLAAVTEVASGALSILDRTFNPGKHVVWRRYREANDAK